MRVSLGEYKKLKAEVAAAKREALECQLELALQKAEIAALIAENKAFKLRIKTL